jgi:hypothetical protein
MTDENTGPQGADAEAIVDIESGQVGQPAPEQGGDQGATPPAKEPSTRETIEKTMRDIKARQQKEAEGAEGQPQEGKPEQPKAAKPVKPAKPGEQPEKGAAAQQRPGESEKAIPGGPNNGAAAPEGWSAPAKAKWTGLDPLVQREIAKREKDFHVALTKQDEERVFGRQMKETAAPYMHIIRAEGGDARAAFQDYLNTAYKMRTASPQEKAQILLAYAQRFGADPATLAAPFTRGPNGQQNSNPAAVQHRPAPDPRIDEVYGFVKAQQVQMEQGVDNAYQAFASDPQNVHFEQVKGIMARLFASDPQGGRYPATVEGLKRAYDDALWQHPEIRESLLQARDATAEQRRREQAKQQAAKARGAAVSVSGGPGSSPGQKTVANPDLPLRDQLRAAFAQHTSQ